MRQRSKVARVVFESKCSLKGEHLARRGNRSVGFAALERLRRATIGGAFDASMEEGVGFEPTSPCGLAVFKTAAIDQLGHPSMTAP